MESETFYGDFMEKIITETVWLFDLPRFLHEHQTNFTINRSR